MSESVSASIYRRVRVEEDRSYKNNLKNQELKKLQEEKQRQEKEIEATFAGKLELFSSNGSLDVLLKLQRKMQGEKHSLTKDRDTTVSMDLHIITKALTALELRFNTISLLPQIQSASLEDKNTVEPPFISQGVRILHNAETEKFLIQYTRKAERSEQNPQLSRPGGWNMLGDNPKYQEALLTSEGFMPSFTQLQMAADLSSPYLDKRRGNSLQKLKGYSSGDVNSARRIIAHPNKDFPFILKAS